MNKFILILVCVILVIIVSIYKTQVLGGRLSHDKFVSKFPVEIIEEIGDGLFGTVFKVAREDETLALKFTHIDSKTIPLSLIKYDKFIKRIPNAQRKHFSQHIDYKIYKCKTYHMSDILPGKFCMEILMDYTSGVPLSDIMYKQYTSDIDYKFNLGIYKQISDVVNLMTKNLLYDPDTHFGNYMYDAHVVKIDNDSLDIITKTSDRYVYNIGMALWLARFAGLDYIIMMGWDTVFYPKDKMIKYIKLTNCWSDIDVALRKIFKGDKEMITQIDMFANDYDADIYDFTMIYVRMLFAIYHPEDCVTYYRQFIHTDWKPLLKNKELRNMLKKEFNV